MLLSSALCVRSCILCSNLDLPPVGCASAKWCWTLALPLYATGCTWKGPHAPRKSKCWVTCIDTCLQTSEESWRDHLAAELRSQKEANQRLQQQMQRLQAQLANISNQSARTASGSLHSEAESPASPYSADNETTSDSVTDFCETAFSLTSTISVNNEEATADSGTDTPRETAVQENSQSVSRGRSRSRFFRFINSPCRFL